MASFWKAIKNSWRAKKDAAAEAMSDPVRDGKYAIEDSKKELARINGEIAKYSASIKRRKRTLDDTEANVKKWDNIAKKAAEAQNEEDVRTAITNKAQAQNEAKTLKAEIAKDESILAKFKSQYQTWNSKVSKAESNHTQLSVRSSAAKARKQFAQSAAGMDSQGCFAELDKLEEQVEADECEAEALEEMAPTNEMDNLADKYGSAGDASVDDEVAKLMAKAAK